MYLMPSRAIVLGGTGMLAGVASWLVGSGWHVVLPSRRYSPIPADADAEGDIAPGRALWVEARWERPQQLARAAEKALGGEADLLVSWIHAGYRMSVLEAVAGLLADKAPIVEVRGDVTADPTRPAPEPTLSGHPTQVVTLGYVREGTTTRWLTHREIVDGVLAAVQRALDERTSAEHQVGDLRPWPPP